MGDRSRLTVHGARVLESGGWWVPDAAGDLIARSAGPGVAHFRVELSPILISSSGPRIARIHVTLVWYVRHLYKIGGNRRARPWFFEHFVTCAAWAPCRWAR